MAGMPQDEYRHNHYVPEWYQKQFMLPGQSKYYRLDLAPERRTGNGVSFTRHDLHHWGARRIFAENDLYTTQWQGITNTDIEQFFFGDLDNKAANAVKFFASFKAPNVRNEAFQNLIHYMSVQKLRTPKGLDFVRLIAGHRNKNDVLALMQRMQQIFCAIWTECVWQIADAGNSPTKFIISDHPVTVYNRACPPGSSTCQKVGDPDIRMHATHTYFPLSLSRVLILTNLSWPRDPYQKETDLRPNPNFFRPAMFKWTSIQTDRDLSEDEVITINYITKKRARRYVAGAEREWLFPEKRMKSLHWQRFGDGYLFMPEPRLLHMGGEIIMGWDDGTSDAFSEYGHKPSQEGFKDNVRFARESRSLDQFQAEWAMLRGPRYIAEDFEWHRKRRGEDDDEDMARHARILSRYRKRGDDRRRKRSSTRPEPQDGTRAGSRN